MDPKFAYRQTAGESASPLQLVVLLYEQLVEDLRRAIHALEHGQSEKHALEVGHALEVLGQLQGRLDMERGGEVARNLELFYDLLRVGLLQAQIRSSAEALRKQLENLLTLREAWLEVERMERNGSVPPAGAPAPDASANPPKPPDWSA